MRKIRGRSAHMGAIAGVAVTGLLLVLPACSSSSSGGSSSSPSGGSSAAVPPAASSAAPSGDAAAGTDDGSKLTLWTRAPLEKQAKLLVAAYNASHKNQVALTVVPNDDYVAKVGAAAGAGNLPDLFGADIVYVPNWVKQGLFQDITKNINGLSFKDSINKGHLAAGTSDGKEYVLPFVLDLSMLFWNKGLFKDAGLDPEKAPANLAEFASDAKAIQALHKKGVYGT